LKSLDLRSVDLNLNTVQVSTPSYGFGDYGV